MVVLHQGLLTQTPFNAIKKCICRSCKTKNILIFYIKWMFLSTLKNHHNHPCTIHYQSSVQLLSIVQLFATPWTAARPPCPSAIPGACSNSCPLSWWCHPIISSSVISFSSHLQSFSASGTFPRSQLFASGGQSIGVSASASVLPVNVQDWFPIGLTGLISLQSLLQPYSSKASILQCSVLFIVQLSHPGMTIGKTVVLTRWTCVGKVMSLLFNMLSLLVIAFLPRSNPFLISWLQPPSAAIWSTRK